MAKTLRDLVQESLYGTTPTTAQPAPTPEGLTPVAELPTLSGKDLIRQRDSVFKRGLQAGGGQAKASFKQLVGDTEGADRALETSQGVASEVGFDQAFDSVGQFGDYVANLAGQSLGAMAPMVAGGAAGAALGAATGGAGVAALGGVLGGVAASTPQYTGSNLLEQRNRGVAPEDLDYVNAAVSALPQAVLDVLPQARAIGQVIKLTKVAKSADKVAGLGGRVGLGGRSRAREGTGVVSEEMRARLRELGYIDDG